jgi:hypothetical protein
MDVQILNRKSARIKRGERTLKKTTSTNDKIEFIKELFTVILAFIVIGIFIFGILLLK